MLCVSVKTIKHFGDLCLNSIFTEFSLPSNVVAVDRFNQSTIRSSEIEMPKRQRLLYKRLTILQNCMQTSRNMGKCSFHQVEANWLNFNLHLYFQ